MSFTELNAIDEGGFLMRVVGLHGSGDWLQLVKWNFMLRISTGQGNIKPIPVKE
jgi:hypothetical protein